MGSTISNTSLVTICDAGFRALVDVGVRACAVFACAAVAALLCRKASAAVRHAVWMVFFVALAVLPVLSNVVPKWRVLPEWRAGEANASAPEVTDAPNANGLVPWSADRRPSPRPAGSLAIDAAIHDTKPASEPSPVGDRPPLSLVTLALWAVGATCLLGRIGCSRFVLHRLSRSATRIDDGPIGAEIAAARGRLHLFCGVTTYVTKDRIVPMTWGPLHTHVLLPSDATGWDPARLRSVLLHELAHAKRGDTLTHVLAQIIRAFYWFHPLVWIAAWRLRAESERACDDLVLRSGVKASDYAADLVHVLVHRPALSAALAMVRRPGLEARVREVLDGTVDRHSLTMRAAASLVTFALVATSALAMLDTSGRAAPSAEPTWVRGEPTPKRFWPPAAADSVVVLCVDSAGKSVPGAQVYLFQYPGGEDERYVQSGPYTSDEQGKATCAEAIFYKDRPDNFDRWVYARIPGKLVGVTRSAKWTGTKAFNPDLRVTLVPSQSVEGHVSVPEGFDPIKVTVRTRTFHVTQGPGPLDFNSFPREVHFHGLDTALPDIFDRRPDAVGNFRFDDVPVRGRTTLVTEGLGLGEAQWSNPTSTFDRPIRISVGRESTISGRVLRPHGRPAAGINVAARLSSRNMAGRPVWYLSTFPTQTDQNGEFTIRGLPQREFHLTIRDPEDRWVIQPVVNLLVQPDEPMRLTLQMENGTIVQGRVLDPDGQPVAHASFSAIIGEGEDVGLGHSTTDAEGRYKFRLPSGTARLYFDSLPDGYTYPDPQIVKQLDLNGGQADIEGLEFTVPRKREADH